MSACYVYLDHSILDWMVKGHLGPLPHFIGEHTVVAIYSSTTLQEIQRSVGFEQRFLDILADQKARYVEPQLDDNDQLTDNATFSTENPRDLYHSHVEDRSNFHGVETLMTNIVQAFMGHAPGANIPDQLQKLLEAGHAITNDAVADIQQEIPADLQSRLTQLQAALSAGRIDVEIPTPLVQELDEHLVGGPKALNNLRPPDIVGQIWRMMPSALTASKTIRQYLSIESDHSPSRAIQTVAVYQFLNHVGYFRDQKLSRQSRMQSSMRDSQHAMHAAYCHVLLTRDQGQAMKAKAAYEFVGIGTEVRLLES